MIPLGELSSVFSAYGIATADLMHVRELSLNMREPFKLNELQAAFHSLSQEADEELARDGIAPQDRVIRRFIEVRYVGQLNDITVEIPIELSDSFDIRSKFEELYVEAFGPGSAWKTAPVEVVGSRVEAIGKRRQFPLAILPKSGPTESHSRRMVYWPQTQNYVETSVFDGALLLADAEVIGPAVVEFPTTTIVVPPGWLCTTDGVGNLMLQKAGDAS
jgi:N-methylhydantoinase A